MVDRPTNLELSKALNSIKLDLKVSHKRIKVLKKFLPNEQRTLLTAASKDIQAALDEIYDVQQSRKLGLW